MTSTETTTTPPSTTTAAALLSPSMAARAEELYRRQKQPWHFLSWSSLLADVTSHFVPVDLTAKWRRHLVWAKNDADKLLQVVTARFTSTTVFLTLLVSAELGTFFSPSRPVEEVRTSLENDEWDTLDFWAGIVLSLSILFAVAALFSNLTAWSIFIVLSPQNAALILRSSMGLYAAQLPNRLVIISLYLFFAWIVLFWFKLLPLSAAIILGSVGILLMIHIASTFSAMGEVVMASSAMSSSAVLPKSEEESLTPAELYKVLLLERDLARQAHVPVNKQYRMDYQEYIRQQFEQRDVEEGRAPETTPSTKEERN